MIDLDAIPDELQDRDQWLMWDSSNDTPRRPHWKGDFMISWSDPDQWHSFDEALKAGRYECGHCQADEYIGSKQLGEHLANKLSKADPEDLGLSPYGERAW